LISFVGPSIGDVSAAPPIERFRILWVTIRAIPVRAILVRAILVKAILGRAILVKAILVRAILVRAIPASLSRVKETPKATDRATKQHPSQNPDRRRGFFEATETIYG
jgi:hypothetical protein